MDSVDLSNYERLELLGQGGFGAVFKVRHKTTGEIFAAKISSKFYSSNNEQLLYIKREVNGMLALNHPCILRFQGFSAQDFSGDPKAVIVMEFAARNSVQEQINLERASQAGPWDDTKKLICIYGLASGMKYLHENNMIHRDIKPENILLTEELLPKIADFGLAKQIHSNKDSKTTESEFGFKGTRKYCSPEIFLANFYSKASDVYAFAMTVYAIMTTETPFKGLLPDEIKSKVINNERPRIPEPLMNTAYESLIQRCWSQDPNERPSFEEIVDELENNEGFITETVDESEYFDYVDYLKEYSSTFDPSKRIELTRLFLQKSLNKSQEVDENANQRIETQQYQQHLNEFSNRGEREGQAQSIQNLKMAADKGDITAMYNYAGMLYHGEGVQMNKEEACRYSKMAADKGDINAMNNYGVMLEHGYGVEMNKEEACRYFKMAADQSNIHAMYNYGYLLKRGDGVAMNKEEACRYFKMAADKGLVDAMNNYGDMLYDGDGVAMNKEEACRYYKMAADKGQMDAMYTYAFMLYNGDGVAMNKEEACRYYKMAHDQRDSNTMFHYPSILNNGGGIAMSKEEACRRCKIYADRGSPEHMNNYGNMLRRGDGVPINKEEACRYYKRAADKGNLEAMNNYGDMLRRGEGVAMNKEEACRYYKMAADKGHLEAMNNYGNMLYNGEGVSMNKEEACRYFDIANNLHTNNKN